MKHPIRISPVKPSTGALDFSHLLDAPAGCHGFVTARDGHFYFEDGKRARFLGFNIATAPTHPPMRMRKSSPHALPAWV